MVTVEPIMIGDLAEVGDFLHDHLNARVSARDWATAPQVPWRVDQPNYGFRLLADTTLVGVMLAFYSDRRIDGRTERICNLAAWCVLPEHRTHSFRMLRAALSQPGYSFTDLSPSGAVVPLDERLGFEHLDAGAQLVPCLPLPTWGTTVVDDRATVEALLDGDALQIYLDHSGVAAAHHVLLRRGGRDCYVIYRRDRRRNLRVFVSVLYVSDPQLFRRSLRAFGSHVLRRRHGLVVLLEERVVGRVVFAPEIGGRPKMFKSATIDATDIDNLYSELMCVAW